jgi:hypothetical protein
VERITHLDAPGHRELEARLGPYQTLPHATRFGAQRSGEPSLGACKAVTLLFNVFQSSQIMRLITIEPKDARQGRTASGYREAVSHQRLLGYSGML